MHTTQRKKPGKNKLESIMATLCVSKMQTRIHSSADARRGVSAWTADLFLHTDSVRITSWFLEIWTARKTESENTQPHQLVTKKFISLSFRFQDTYIMICIGFNFLMTKSTTIIRQCPSKPTFDLSFSFVVPKVFFTPILSPLLLVLAFLDVSCCFEHFSDSGQFFFTPE